jgi:adenylate cyclase
MGEALRSVGFLPAAVRDAEAALASLGVNGVPALFVIELLLPGRDGLRLLAALRDDPQTAGAGVIVLTGARDRANLCAAFYQGADDFVTKPFDPVEVALRARAVVARRSGVLGDPRLQRLDLTAMFADVRGFTPLTEQIDPETAVTVLNNLFESLDGAIAAHGGQVDNFIGDGLMALFRASAPGTTPELRACRAALEMQTLAQAFARESLSLAAHAGDFGIGIGIACGVAVLGALGTRRKRQFTAIGNPVNLAARLEALAERGEVVIDGEVAIRLGPLARLSAPREAHIKGKEQPRLIYRLTGLA